MNYVFWASLGFIAYTYAGYLVVLVVRSRWHRCPVRAEPIAPRVTIIVAVHNEAAALPQKLENLLALDYPADRLEIVAVSDGSTDGTNAILHGRGDTRLRILILSHHRGKAVALNEAMRAAGGEIIVFTDARQLVERQALKHLVANFADPSVGCVSGELMLGDPAGAQSAQGLGLYWRFEKLIRRCESQSGSVVGATGALYAARKSVLAPLPEGTLLD
ncbi:MAG: glycosyltransferase, partial [Terriglobia bacterium]